MPGSWRIREHSGTRPVLSCPGSARLPMGSVSFRMADLSSRCFGRLRWASRSLASAWDCTSCSVVFLLPSFLLYGPVVGGFDRDSIIYPLRDGYRDSRDVQRALEALGQIDELLSFHRYAKAFGGSTVLPTLIDS